MHFRKISTSGGGTSVLLKVVPCGHLLGREPPRGFPPTVKSGVKYINILSGYLHLNCVQAGGIVGRSPRHLLFVSTKWSCPQFHAAVHN